MTPEQTSQKSVEKHHRRNFDTLFNTAGVVVSVASGVLGAWFEASRAFNNRVLSKFGFIRELHSKRDKALHSLGIKDQHGKPFNPPLVGEALIQEEQRILKQHQADKAAALAQRGIKGPWAKWRLLDTHGKKDAIVMASAAASVALGFVMALGSVRHLTEQQKDLEGRMNELEGQKQR